MGQRLFRRPVRLRMGACEEPSRCLSVDSEGRVSSGHGAGCPRSVEAPCANDGDYGSRAEGGPALREDFEAFPPEPKGIRRRLRQGVVQDDPPRHGSHLAVSRRARSCRAAAVARPCAHGRSCINRRAGHCCSEGQDPRIRSVDLSAGHDGLGLGGNVPWQRQARRGERIAHPSRAAEGLGSQSAARTGKGPGGARSDPGGV